MSAIAASASARRAFWALLAAGGAVLAVALGAAHYMEEHGHVVTGMNNQVVWGLPHVFAIFLIVAASGALNVASVGSVFGEKAYKPLAPLSVLLTVALLAGGLMVLVLDLGRPERLVVAATHYNFRSIFAWNMILYNGLFAICALYLWSLLERRLGGYSKPVGLAAFAWRIILTTGTGSIFGFLVARQAYASGVIAPLFIALSLAWGLAAFHLAQCGLARLAGQEAWDDALHARVRRLLGIFVIAALYFVIVHHMTSMPRVWAFRRVAICRPAASSIAELTRKPVPRRVIEVDRALLVLAREPWVEREAALVCRLNMMGALLKGLSVGQAFRPALPFTRRRARPRT